MSIRISALIPTYNREKYLIKALQSLLDQTLPAEEYEIIVIDNRSTDTTKRIVTEDFAHIPNLRYLYEPVAGLNQARNTGWTNARGKYVAFIDDDAIACPQWLEKIIDVFETMNPKPGCVGGKVEAIWESPRPTWLADEMLPYLTVFDWSNKPIELNNPQFLAGANFSFPKQLLELIDGFKAGVDRVGGKLLSNGDIMIERQLHELGYSCFYHPEISVQHHVPASRLTQKWFLQRVFWQGVSDAVMEKLLGSVPRWRAVRKALRITPGLLLLPRRYRNFLKSTNNPHEFAFACSTYGRAGYILGLLGILP